MAHNERQPATLVICCHAPRGIGPSEAAAWRQAAEREGQRVTWIVSASDADAWLSSTAAGDLAVRLEAGRGGCRRQASRAAMRLAIRGLPGVTAAFVDDPHLLDHRDLLLAEGISVAAVRQFDPEPRRSRRPPPQGWACRSLLWGLWETSLEPPRRRLRLPWSGEMPAASLRFIETGSTSRESAAVALRKLEHALRRVSRDEGRGRCRTIRLGELPARIEGRDSTAGRGNILRAA